MKDESIGPAGQVPCAAGEEIWILNRGAYEPRALEDVNTTRLLRD